MTYHLLASLCSPATLADYVLATTSVADITADECDTNEGLGLSEDTYIPCLYRYCILLGPDRKTDQLLWYFCQNPYPHLVSGNIPPG